MASFDEALTFVLRHEDPHLSGIVTEDSGGRTRFGIAERSHPELGDDYYSGPLDEALATARQIYCSYYWRPMHGDEIGDQQVAAKLLDMGVNMGVHQTIVLCQRAVNAISSFRVAEDGIFGPQTLAVVNRCNSESLLTILRETCAAFYQHVAAIRPEMREYLHGWLARARA
jgi:lysozyme family protein